MTPIKQKNKIFNPIALNILSEVLITSNIECFYECYQFQRVISSGRNTSNITEYIFKNNLNTFNFMLIFFLKRRFQIRENIVQKKLSLDKIFKMQYDGIMNDEVDGYIFIPVRSTNA